MSIEQLKALLSAAQSDPTLQEKLKTASNAEGVVSLARGAGFSISPEDLMHASMEISDAELEGATGGLAETMWRNIFI